MASASGCSATVSLPAPPATTTRLLSFHTTPPTFFLFLLLLTSALFHFLPRHTCLPRHRRLPTGVRTPLVCWVRRHMVPLTPFHPPLFSAPATSSAPLLLPPPPSPPALFLILASYIMAYQRLITIVSMLFVISANSAISTTFLPTASCLNNVSWRSPFMARISRNVMSACCSERRTK